MIDDDVTGATDLASELSLGGLSVIQLNGEAALTTSGWPPTDAVVVALKIRTAPPAEAGATALVAAEWMRQREIEQVYWKCGSTFDSTRVGNIGPRHRGSSVGALS